MAKDKDRDPVASAGMWGAIAGAASNIVGSAGQFIPGVRESNLAIAEANARAAEANAGSAGTKMFGIEKKWLMIGGGVLAFLIIAMVLMNKKG